MKLLLQTQKKVSKFLLRSFGRIKCYKQKYSNSIFNLDKVEAAILVTICFLLFIHSSHAGIQANRSTNATGSWATASIWTGSVVPAAADGITVNHALTLNANLSISGAYIFNSAVTDAPGGTAYTVTVNNGGSLEVKANMVAGGDLLIKNGGSLIIRSGVTVTVGAATFSNGSSVLIETGGKLIVNGILSNNNNSNDIEVNGEIAVNGKVDAGNGSTITGTGMLTTTISGNAGSISNDGTIFGSTGDCVSGTCSFVSPCNPAASATSIASAGSAVCTGASITLSAVAPSGASTYQWQSSLTGTTYANITGATNATYAASPAATTYYKLRVVFNSSLGGCNYTTTASTITINSKSIIPTSSSGTSTICSGLSASVTAIGGSLGTDAVAAWYQGACPAFTEDWGGTSSPWMITNGTTINYVSGGYMNVSALSGSPTDPQIMMKPTGASFNPNTYKYIKVRYRVNSGNPGNIQIYFMNGTYPNADPNAVVVSSALITDGNWNIATIDMSSSSNWTTGGNIIGWRFDYATDVANMDIDYITLTAAPVSSPVSPTVTTQYHVRYEGLCNSTACLGTPVTITVKPTPTIATTTPNSRCGTGSVTLMATASAGTVNWYDGLGILLTTGSSYPALNLLASTTYYVDATNNGCTTASRTAVTATINACAMSWLGVTSTDWNATTNWNLGIIPTIINSITIPSGTPYSPQVAGGTGNVSSIVINTGAALTVTSTGILNVYGNISTAGTGILITNSGSTVVFKGSSAQTINGVSTLNNVQIANTSGGVSISSALTVKGTLTLTNGILTTNSNLTVNFDNGGNIAYNVSDAGSISGTVTGRRDVSARTHYISSPFAGVTSTQVNATTPLFYNNYWKMYTKTFATQGWAAVTHLTTAMPLGAGFSLAYPAATSLKLSGTYDAAFSFTSTSFSNAAAAKFMLIGNPYPSTINWSTIYSGGGTVNTGGAVYYWNAANNQVSTWIAATGGTNGGSQYIPAMQAFMVATTGTGGPTSSVSINNTARVANNSTYFRTIQAENSILKLYVKTADGITDETLISLNNEATEDFEFDKDAYKIINSGFTPSLYTLTHAGPTMYSINSLPFDEGQSIPLNLKVFKDGVYELHCNELNNQTGYTILLEDKLNNVFVPVDTALVYTISAKTSDNTDRFVLRFRAGLTTGTKSSDNLQDMQIYSSTKGFVINTNKFGNEQADIELLDITGNSVKVMNNTSLTATSTYIAVDLSAGSYLVKVTINGYVFTSMISLVK